MGGLDCGFRSLAGALVAAGISIAPVAAEPVADFYKGKTITMLTGFGAGGMYGMYSRIVNKHMARHIPGAPTMVVQFMPGAGGTKAANYFFRAAPKDGTVIGMLSQSIAVTQMLKAGAHVRYDAAKLHWLGSIDGVVNLLSVWNPSTKVRSIKDARRTEVIAGATGKGSIGYMNMVLTKALLGAKLRIITGYKGIAGVDKALEGDEVQARAGTWISIKTRKKNWTENGRVTHIVQYALKKHPDLPNVPLAIDLADSDEDRAMLEFAASSSVVGRSLSLPPGVPAARVAALRKAFEATMRDPAFLKEARSRQLPILWSNAEDVSRIVQRTVSSSSALIERLKGIISSGG